MKDSAFYFLREFSGVVPTRFVEAFFELPFISILTGRVGSRRTKPTGGKISKSGRVSSTFRMVREKNPQSPTSAPPIPHRNIINPNPAPGPVPTNQPNV